VCVLVATLCGRSCVLKEHTGRSCVLKEHTLGYARSCVLKEHTGRAVLIIAAIKSKVSGCSHNNRAPAPVKNIMNTFSVNRMMEARESQLQV
jgi:hypothetical protein